MSKVTKYEGSGVDVTWHGGLCIHVQECGRAKNDVFVGGRKPWCDPDTTPADTVIDTVLRCPTGALSFHRKDGGPVEVAAPDNTVIVSNNGPLYVRGDLAIDGATDDMPAVRFRAALCRCGQSKNKPFCDNSHEAAGFTDHGAVGEPPAGREAEGGQLEVHPTPNGPLLLQGNVRLIAASGRVAWEGSKCALCRCGNSKNKPFCDGTHRKIGFDSST